MALFFVWFLFVPVCVLAPFLNLNLANNKRFPHFRWGGRERAKNDCIPNGNPNEIAGVKFMIVLRDVTLVML